MLTDAQGPVALGLVERCHTLLSLPIPQVRDMPEQCGTRPDALAPTVASPECHIQCPLQGGEATGVLPPHQHLSIVSAQLTHPCGSSSPPPPLYVRSNSVLILEKETPIEANSAPPLLTGHGLRLDLPLGGDAGYSCTSGGASHAFHVTRGIGTEGDIWQCPKLPALAMPLYGLCRLSCVE